MSRREKIEEKQSNKTFFMKFELPSKHVSNHEFVHV